MNEEVGSVGKRKKLIAGVIVAIIIIACTSWVLLNYGGEINSSISVDLYWDSVDAGDAWHITVIGVEGPDNYTINSSISDFPLVTVTPQFNPYVTLREIVRGFDGRVWEFVQNICVRSFPG